MIYAWTLANITTNDSLYVANVGYLYKQQVDAEALVELMARPDRQKGSTLLHISKVQPYSIGYCKVS
jgi:hypothetical protein